MTLLQHLLQQTFPTAFSLLPIEMGAVEAAAMMIAVGLQETELKVRRQLGGGPARGLWQFEREGGVREILTVEPTRQVIIPICKLLLYTPIPSVCHEAIEHNDVLAACFTRLLLWRDARALPTATQDELGWEIYNDNWRPGRPHPEKWSENFARAWAAIQT